MILYINGKQAFFEKDFDVNMTFKFVDTYNPSAVKTSYSKTVSLPDCRQNAEIFGDFKVKYNFDLFNDDGRVVEKGYCTLDSIKTVGTQKTYNITLYGGLGDFFYNLKGDEDNPKTLENLSFSGIPNSGIVMTWDPEYVMRTWMEPESSPITDTFRAVPCIYDDKIMDKSHTIIPANGGLFPANPGGGLSPFMGQDGSEALLVESEENTCYAMQDFRSDLMPLGIKYKSIIQACCNPSNNGGYSVYLDPDFFNANNPYWNNMFLLKTLPSLDYDYTTKPGVASGFQSQLIKAGNYQAQGPSATRVLVPVDPGIPWTVEGDSLVLDTSYTLVEDKVEFNITPFIQLAYPECYPNNVASAHRDDPYVTYNGNLRVTVYLMNDDTSEMMKVAERIIEPNTEFKVLGYHEHLGRPVHLFIRDLYYLEEPITGITDVPPSWTKIQIVVNLEGNRGNYTLHYKDNNTDRYKTLSIRGDFCVPSSKNIVTPCVTIMKDSWEFNYPDRPWSTWGPHLPDSYLSFRTGYLDDINLFEPLEFTKKDLLQGTSSPFDYLVWFTKMFNLRFYMEPGTKKVSILTANNFVRELEPLDIHDKICYDKDYSKTRKIIDEGYLKFDLTPNSNPTVEAYIEDYDENLFDSVYAVPAIEGKRQKEYLSNGLKIGSKARIKSPFAIREVGNYNFYGFNQAASYNVTYISGSQLDHKTEEFTLNYDGSRSQRYDFLTLDEDINNTVVMFSGLKETPFGNTAPAIVSRTSVDMVRFAGRPCWMGGVPDGAQGSVGSLLGAEYILTYQIPHYGLVPSVSGYSNGLSYSNVNYESLIVTSNIYDRYLKGWLDKIYLDPLVVECWVRLSSPELRRLYWFNNEYWVLTEISNYNYRDEPVKCKFIRYRYA